MMCGMRFPPGYEKLELQMRPEMMAFCLRHERAGQQRKRYIDGHFYRQPRTQHHPGLRPGQVVGQQCQRGGPPVPCRLAR